MFFIKKKNPSWFHSLYLQEKLQETLKMDVTESKIPLDTKCNGDFGIMADYCFS